MKRKGIWYSTAATSNKNPKENKNRRPLNLTANMIINVKPLKAFPVM